MTTYVDWRHCMSTYYPCNFNCLSQNFPGDREDSCTQRRHLCTAVFARPSASRPLWWTWLDVSAYWPEGFLFGFFGTLKPVGRAGLLATLSAFACSVRLAPLACRFVATVLRMVSFRFFASFAVFFCAGALPYSKGLPVLGL